MNIIRLEVTTCDRCGKLLATGQPLELTLLGTIIKAEAGGDLLVQPLPGSILRVVHANCPKHLTKPVQSAIMKKPPETGA